MEGGKYRHSDVQVEISMWIITEYFKRQKYPHLYVLLLKSLKSVRYTNIQILPPASMQQVKKLVLRPIIKQKYQS